MDDKTKGLLIAAVVGLALAYYLNTAPAAAAEPLAPGGVLPPTGGGYVPPPPSPSSSKNYVPTETGSMIQRMTNWFRQQVGDPRDVAVDGKVGASTYDNYWRWMKATWIAQRLAGDAELEKRKSVFIPARSSGVLGNGTDAGFVVYSLYSAKDPNASGGFFPASITFLDSLRGKKPTEWDVAMLRAANQLINTNSSWQGVTGADGKAIGSPYPSNWVK